MNSLAIFGNCAVLVFLAFGFFLEPVWKGGTREIIVFVLIFIVPIVNLIALYAKRKRDRKDFISLISLFWERKRLEQEKKILELKKEMGK